MSIEVRGVGKRFGDFVALEDVTLSVETGSLTALLGPSGSGKSTLLRIVAGLEQPDAGTVSLDGEDVTGVPPQARGVGFVFQHYAAFKHMTVRRNVAFGLEIRRRPKAEIAARVDELLELVQLRGLADRYPAQLSGGQRQRMALARALAVEPGVLLLDEPFGALDARVRRELRRWLRRLHDEQHVTTVIVTHDQEEAMDVADEIALMHAGRIEQVGGPRELYDAPANDVVRAFFGPVVETPHGSVRPHDLVLSLDEHSRVVRGHGLPGRPSWLRGARRPDRRRGARAVGPADPRRGGGAGARERPDRLRLHPQRGGLSGAARPPGRRRGRPVTPGARRSRRGRA